MGKKTVVQSEDKYVLRLPDGMRDRIRAAAEKHGRSMNAEIVAALSIHFPEPFSLEKRLADLAILTQSLKQTPNSAIVDQVIEELERTLEAIATGQAPELGEEVREKIHEELIEWEERKSSRYSDRVYQFFEDAGEEYPNLKDVNERP